MAWRAGRERDRNGRPKGGSDPPTGGEGPIAVDSPTPEARNGRAGLPSSDDPLRCLVGFPLQYNRKDGLPDQYINNAQYKDMGLNHIVKMCI